MQLVVLGINHKTAPVEIRECFSFSEEAVKSALWHARQQGFVDECVILSTCNRTEVYATVEDAEEAMPVLQSFLEQMAGGKAAGAEFLFYYVDVRCIRHLFMVAASLDSLIVGEGQILSQVKTAYSIARDVGTTSTIFNTLFHRAIAVGKKVRTETRIAFSAVSVSYAAVQLAKKIFGDLSVCNVLLLGAGQMGELTARHLIENGVKTVFVSNRKYDRAVSLAKKFHGTAIPFEGFIKCAAHADIVITSTGAPHYLIRSWDVAHLMPKRAGKPIVFIDIAVPRDVEPEVAAIQGVSVYNIDDLEAVVQSNIQLRGQEAETAKQIIEQEIKELLDKFRYLSFRPTIALLADKSERMRQRELKRAFAKLPELSREQRKVVESMSKMIVRKLLRDPMIRVNEAAGTDHEQFYVDAIGRLFKLDGLGENETSERKVGYRYARQ